MRMRVTGLGWVQFDFAVVVVVVAVVVTLKKRPC